MKEIIITHEATIEAEGKLNSRHCVPIVAFNVKTGVIKSFSSLIDAADGLDVHRTYVSYCLNRKKLCKGHKLCRTDEVHTFMDDIVSFTNRNAEDAGKWREQEAEMEKIRKAEEKRLNEIQKKKDRLVELEVKITKCSEKYRELIDEYNTTKEELAMMETE